MTDQAPMTVSHEGQQRVPQEPRGEGPCGFIYPSGYLCGVGAARHWQPKHPWQPRVPDWPLGGSSTRGHQPAAILASVLPDPRVEALIDAATGVMEARSSRMSGALSALGAALRAFDDKPDEEVER